MLLFVTIAVLAVVTGLVVIHLPVVQEALWNRATTSIARSTGWQIDADSVRMRIWPARFEATGVSAGTGGPPVLDADRVEISFRWRAIARRPHRLDRVEIEGPRVDLARLQIPESPGPEASSSAVDPWRAIEVGVLRVTDGSLIGADGLPIGFRVDGLTARGTLEKGEARLEVSTDGLNLDKDGRILDLGRLTISARGGPTAIRLDSLDLAGEAITANATADFSTTPPLSTRAQLTSSIDLARVASWWDPVVAARANPRGRLHVEGRGMFDDRSGLDVELEHSGPAFSIGEIEVAAAGVSHRGGRTHGWLDFGSRGRLELDTSPEGPVRVTADLDGLPLDASMSLLDHPYLANLPTGMRLSGRLNAEIAQPFSATSISADGWSQISWPEGELMVAGRGTLEQWRVDELRLSVPGATATAAGLGRADRVSAEMKIDAHDPGTLVDFIDRWRPGLANLGIGGGPVSISGTLEGTLQQPRASGSFQWLYPELPPYSLDKIHGAFAGGTTSLDWEVIASPAPGVRATADGTVRWNGFQTHGLWTVDIEDLGLLPLEVPEEMSPIRGVVDGGGRFAWSPDDWFVDGILDARDVDGVTWYLDKVGVSFEATPERLAMEELRLDAGDGFIRATGSLAPADLTGDLEASLVFDRVDLEQLGTPATGTVSGNLNLSGSPALPEGVGMVGWVPPDDFNLAHPLTVSVRLIDGVAEADFSGWETAAGPVSGRAVVPMGGLPRPEWLWPDAPGGPLKAHLDGLGVRSAPVLAALGRDPLPIQASGNVSVDLEADLSDPEQRFLRTEVENLIVTGPNVNMTAHQTLRLTMGDGRIELEPLRLEGPLNRMDIGGVYEMDTSRLVGGAEMVADPSFLELLPYPVQATGSMTVRAGVDGPINAATATLEVDHTGGTVVLREPAARITDLRLSARMDEGVLWIDDGEAGVNRGRVLIGGGWDPVSGQGVIFEMEEVTALLSAGIVTNWSGTIAVEPAVNHDARIVGEIGLNAGLWERTFDITEAFFSSPVIEMEDNPVLADIALDLQVRGYGGVRVANNLGNFDASWGLLEVGGTLSRPVITGGIRLAPGGTVKLPGQTVTIRTAQVDFTGNPETDPSIEIIPEHLGGSVTAGGAGGSTVDTRALATESLAQGLGSALGLENTTLQPAEIAFETQTDASSAFTAGTRLSRTVALFFTTDLSDVQNQTTMLQLWNLRGLPGLALQGFTRTAEDDLGINAIERYRWGGTKPSDDKPVIQKIKIDGDWPISGRRLRKATGLRKGEPYDPFLLFAAGLNLEAELASAGFPRARVHTEAVGDERLPVLIFTVDPGPEQEFRFTGHVPPTAVQRAAVGQFLPKPHEAKSLEEIQRTLMLHYANEGFPDAQVTVQRQGDDIVVNSVRGEAVRLVGPVVEGVPEDIGRSISAYLQSAAELARISKDPARATVVVNRVLGIEGYPEARLADIWVSVEGSDHVVHLRIDPGPPIILADVVVSGSDPLGVLTDGISGLQKGVPLDRNDLDRALGNIRSQYRAAGFAEVTLVSEISATEDDQRVVTIDLEPGPQRTVREIRVTGLRHVRESVIIEGLSIQPGETVTPEAVDQSAIDTAFFAPIDQTNFRTSEAGPNQVDLEVDVTEKPRWTVEAGAGWSTERGARLQFGFRDDGLLGRGAGIGLRAQWEEIQQQATLYLALPPLPGGRWSSVANALWYSGDSQENRDKFTEERIGLGIETTYSLTRASSARGYLRFVQSETDVKDPRDDPFDAFPVTTQESIVGTQLALDNLDNPFDPRSGWYAAADLSHNAPTLGSDFNDLRLVLTGSAAITPRTGWTWSQALRLGAAEALGDSRLASVRRFYAGGQASVRGFDLDSIGPFRIDSEGIAIPSGGGAMVILNEELRVPVWGPLRLAVFADVGQVWPTWSEASFDFSVGAGAGLRFSTPIGPLWADVAWPVANRNISSPGPKYYIGIGTPF